MNKVSPLHWSRRSGLAAAATLVLSALSRPGVAQAQGSNPLLTCCGNGPPVLKKNGLGMQVVPQTPPLTIDGPELVGPSYAFTNTVVGPLEKERLWFVFVESRQITTVYKDPDGNDGDLVVYRRVKNFVGVAYRVEPRFTLTLTWPDGVTALFYTRPFGPDE
jgi:hypothetical protein